MRREPSFDWRLAHFFWSLALLLPAGAAALIALAALLAWDPAITGRTPGWSTAAELSWQLRLAAVVAGVIAVLSLAHVAAAVAGTIRPRWSARTASLTMLAALPIAGSPVLIHLMVPIEDPYDGSGSPMAVLISIFFYTVVGAGFATPGVILLARRWWVTRWDWYA